MQRFCLHRSAWRAMMGRQRNLIRWSSATWNTHLRLLPSFWSLSFWHDHGSPRLDRHTCLLCARRTHRRHKDHVLMERLGTCQLIVLPETTGTRLTGHAV